MYLLGVGGLFYTVGITFFVLEKISHPIYHAIWHLAVLAGAGCHYMAVLLFVVGLENEAATGQCANQRT